MKPSSYANRILEERSLARVREIHVSKREHPHSLGVDNTSPKEYPHVMRNAKRRMKERERILEIERENRLLLTKMTAIGSRSLKMDRHTEFSPGMRLDSSQTPVLDSYISPRTTAPGAAVPKPSMNYEVRKREAERIATDNLRLLDRIVHTKPILSARALDDEARRHDEYLAMISTRPVGEPGTGLGAYRHSPRRARSLSPRRYGAYRGDGGAGAGEEDEGAAAGAGEGDDAAAGGGGARKYVETRDGGVARSRSPRGAARLDPIRGRSPRREEPEGSARRSGDAAESKDADADDDVGSASAGVRADASAPAAPPTSTRGVLELQLAGATGLDRVDSFGIPNPFVVLATTGASSAGRAVARKSSVQSNTLAPAFEETFQLPVDDVTAAGVGVDVRVYHQGARKVVRLGVGRVDVAAVADRLRTGAKVALPPVTLTSAAGKSAGTVTLSLRFRSDVAGLAATQGSGGTAVELSTLEAGAEGASAGGAGAASAGGATAASSSGAAASAASSSSASSSSSSSSAASSSGPGLFSVTLERAVITERVPGRLSKANCDPYVVVRVGRSELRSRWRDDTYNPVWNETLTLPLDSLAAATAAPLILRVLDKEEVGSDIFLGEVSLALDRFTDALLAGTEVNFGGAQTIEGPSKTGSLFLKARWDASADARRAIAEATRFRGAVTVHLHSAVIGAGAAPAGSKKPSMDPFVILRVADREVRSRVCYDTYRPSWDADLKLEVADLRTATLEGRIVDEDPSGRDETVGTFSIPFADKAEGLVGGTPVRAFVAGYKAVAGQPNGTVRVDLAFERSSSSSGSSGSTATAAGGAGAGAGGGAGAGVRGVLTVRLGAGLVQTRDGVRELKTDVDPYVVLRAGDREARSSVRYDTLRPTWDEDVPIDVADLAALATITGTVMDAETTGRDLRIGDVAIDLAPHREALLRGTPVRLGALPISGPKTGFVHVDLSFRPS